MVLPFESNANGFERENIALRRREICQSKYDTLEQREGWIKVPRSAVLLASCAEVAWMLLQDGTGKYLLLRLLYCGLITNAIFATASFQVYKSKTMSPIYLLAIANISQPYSWRWKLRFHNRCHFILTFDHSNVKAWADQAKELQDKLDKVSVIWIECYQPIQLSELILHEVAIWKYWEAWFTIELGVLLWWNEKPIRSRWMCKHFNIMMGVCYFATLLLATLLLAIRLCLWADRNWFSRRDSLWVWPEVTCATISLSYILANVCFRSFT